MTNITDAKMHERPCPICGSNHRKHLKTRTLELPASPTPVHWEMHDAVCLYCAFVYSAKVYPDDYIEDYYHRTTIEVVPDYDAASRAMLINRYVPDGGSVLEYGPGVSGLCDVLDDKYDVDTFRIGDETPVKRYDLTAAYFVLEHVSDPRGFIYRMRFVTKPRGFVIVEVPDFTRRPRETLYPEHLNYFTEFHLKILLETSGLTVIECIQEHSRNFGMAMMCLVNPCRVTEATRVYGAGRGGCMV